MAKKNNITITHPHLIKEWDYEKNGNMLPENYSKGQQIKVFWKCEEGHSFVARIDHRCSMKSGCPYCSHRSVLKGETDLATLYPEIAAEWDYDKNSDNPDEYMPQSNKNAFWICPICGNSYSRKIQDRTVRGFGCPRCIIESHTSMQEQAIAFYFSKITMVENRIKKYGKELDVFLPELNTGIEYNGEYYHSDKSEKDNSKYEKLKSHGIRVIVLQSGRTRSVEGDTITMCTKEKANPTNSGLSWGLEQAFSLTGLSFS